MAMTKNKNSYTFEQLSVEAQKKACKEYLEGWLVTHPREKNEVDMEWAKQMCESDNKTFYNENGDVLDC